MRKTFVIAQFEFMQRARSPMLMIMLVISPILTVFTTFVPLRTALSASTEQTQWIGMIDETATLVSSLNEYYATHFLLQNGQPRFMVLPLLPQEAASDELSAVVRARSHDEGVRITIERDATGDRLFATMLQSAVEASQRQTQLPRVSIQMSVQEATQNSPRSTSSMLALIAAISLNILTLTLVSGTGQLLVRSMFEERSTRLFDVIVSSASPRAFLLGKYLGVLAFGVVHCVCWCVVVWLSAVRVFGVDFGVQVLTIGTHAFITFVCFAAVYLLYAAVVERESTAQALSTLTTFALIIPLSLILGSDSTTSLTMHSIISLLPPYATYGIALDMVRHVPVSPRDMVFAYTLTVSAASVLVVVAIRMFERSVRQGGARNSRAIHITS